MVLGYIALTNRVLDTTLFNSVYSAVNFDNSVYQENNSERHDIRVLQHKRISSDLTNELFSSDEIVVHIEGFCTRNHVKIGAKDIADLFQVSGMSFLDNIAGEFAIIIFDLKKNEYYFTRDHIGTIPLSVAENKGALYFCNDSMGLAKGLFCGQDIDQNYIQSRFYDYEVNYSYTPHPSVKKILPGHYAKFNASGLEFIEYWKPQSVEINKNRSSKEVVNFFREAITRSLSVGMNDQKIGVHVSGGLDSTLLAVLVSKMNKETIGFTWSPENFDNNESVKYDERELIQKQCETSGVELVYTDISESDYTNFLNNWRAPSESIFEDKVQQSAIEKNVNLIVSGWGGDDFIGLRDEALYFEAYKEGGFKRLYKLFRKTGFKNKMMHFFNNVISPLRRKEYLKYKIYPKYYKYLESGIGSNELDVKSQSIYKSKRDYQLGMINYYHIAQRCDDWYVSGQRKGIIYRYPLLSKEIVEYSLSLPAIHFISSEYDRPVMRELCRDHLIDGIRLLEKQGDPVLMRNAMNVQKKVLDKLISELPQLESDKYLSFIDTEQLISDLTKGDSPKGYLYFLLHQIFSTHFFTKKYHDSAN